MSNNLQTESKCPFNHKLRPELPPLTPRIAALPVDERGYPVPFFVQWIDGKPDFRVSDGRKLVRCVKEKLCWTCGQPLGSNKAFGIGPMCAINRISSEPPSHVDCLEWSVKGCPFLSRPNMVRREDEMTIANKVNVPGVMIERNPGVTLIWVTKSYKLVRDNGDGVLFSVGDPENVSWWREGRAATLEEVTESIRTGLPELEKACEMESTPERRKEAHEALILARARIEPLLPTP